MCYPSRTCWWCGLYYLKSPPLPRCRVAVAVVLVAVVLVVDVVVVDVLDAVLVIVVVVVVAVVKRRLPQPGLLNQRFHSTPTYVYAEHEDEGERSCRDQQEKQNQGFSRFVSPGTSRPAINTKQRAMVVWWCDFKPAVHPSPTCNSCIVV